MRPLALGCLAVLFVSLITNADEPSKSDDQTKRSEQPIAKQYAQLLAEYEAELAASRQAGTRAQAPAGKRAVAEQRPRDLITDYSRKLVELAQSSPADPAARDALLWVVNKPGRGYWGAFGDEFARAGSLLVRYHGDDPEAVRIGLSLRQQVNPRCDAILLGFYVAAKGREAKGLARLALAQYLAQKASHVVYARSVEGRPKRRQLGGGQVVTEFEMRSEEFAYHLELRQCDPQIIRADAVRLYEEVISDYADVPYLTRRRRELEALLKEPAPLWNGKPLTPEDRSRIETTFARKRTLGQEAEAGLDEMLNLAVGKPAPEIDGEDVDGKRFKLSDYQGKVVVLVFWGSWCGPCMADVPHERELVERMKGQQFALLGVDCEPEKETAKKTMTRERMTWPNWFDGAPGTGPIAKRYNVRGYPSVFILDAKGVIRSRRAIDLDQTVDKLLEEMKRPASPQGASRQVSGERSPP